MTGKTRPFAAFEWMIAWRYLRARRAEGGVSVMTWISLIGITLAVFALIATLSVRSGFRAEFVDTILGANAHVTIYAAATFDDQGRQSRVIEDFDAMAERVAAVPGVTRVAPLIKGQVMASRDERSAGVEVFGIRHADLMTIPRIAAPEEARGDIARFDEGIAIGSGVARELGVVVGDRIRLISPDGAQTAFGTSPAGLGLRGRLHLHRRALRHRPHARLHAVFRGAVLFQPRRRRRRARGDGRRSRPGRGA
jgi:lipoprotein-releasing system permease protein